MKRRLYMSLALPFLMVLFLALVAGCRGGEDGLLFEDRFGNPRSGWGSNSQDAFDRGYEEGEYFIELYEPDWFVWAVPDRRFTDVDVAVEARRVSGATDGHFGLLCRYRSPGDFYYLAVTADGYYAILRLANGEPEVLTGDGFLPSAAVRADGSPYHIRAVCRGEEIALYVNGEQIAAVTDDLLRRGDVGLGVGSGPSGAIRIHFDNLTVAAVEEGGGK